MSVPMLRNSNSGCSVMMYAWDMHAYDHHLDEGACAKRIFPLFFHLSQERQKKELESTVR
jgi:hypothetical protein